MSERAPDLIERLADSKRAAMSRVASRLFVGIATSALVMEHAVARQDRLPADASPVIPTTTLADTSPGHPHDPSIGGGFAPWRFGMTNEDIAAIAEAGPYTAFSNGDLETYNSDFGGKKRNVQFFMKDGKLTRIGVYMYEGQDFDAALQSWSETYTLVEALYGQVEVPGSPVKEVASPRDSPDQGNGVEPVATTRAVAMLGVAMLVKSVGKAQMAPVRQPTDAKVFSSFWRGDVKGQTWYYVVLNFSQR